MPPVRLHDLRHGAATLALASGTELKVVQGTLGHASIVLTADTYVSVLPQLYRDSARATARLVLKAVRATNGRSARVGRSVTHDQMTRLQARVKPQVGVVGRVGLEPTTHGL
ncbi:tyrosine-type recombinase/integrase [Nonomuraea sp. NPDC050394]|uniref:tyrosine-type recombinase/integrase n=1 Tax=Nonomuraea sp. NPDC050394 TaxID=3364363 RepID=UPI00378B181D